MTKDAIKFIKQSGYTEKNINYFDKEIQTKREYDELYAKSYGSISSNGFVLFITNSCRIKIENQKLDMYLISEKVNKEIFNIEIPIGLVL